MEIQPQNPEFRSYPENFHPWRELHETCGVCVREIKCCLHENKLIN